MAGVVKLRATSSNNLNLFFEITRIGFCCLVIIFYLQNVIVIIYSCLLSTPAKASSVKCYFRGTVPQRE